MRKVKNRTQKSKQINQAGGSYWAIDVNRNWRVVFEFKDGNAYVVDYEDYH
ncbi:type II toxin-antitoxin system RelE/ParE family toxin [Desulforhopalus vacuolatus]|nr:type II toxin-antitoxin system RelE/ParE family toxin [Desulforhopalus vacuolatus]